MVIKNIVHESFQLIFLDSHVNKAHMNKEILKYTDTPTNYVDVDGIRYAYRMLGKPSDIPLVCLQHFTGTLDNWDPTITNGLAQDRRVVTIDNAVCHENRKKP